MSGTNFLPKVSKLASYAANNVGGGDFLEVPGRKTPIMITADDSSAYGFAPYANSYFPAVILEVSPKGRFQFAADLMRSKLPAQPPPVCGQPAATNNPWLKERCGEYVSSRRNARAWPRSRRSSAEIEAGPLRRPAEVGRLLRHRRARRRVRRDEPLRLHRPRSRGAELARDPLAGQRRREAQDAQHAPHRVERASSPKTSGAWAADYR
jgi:hypothetical protein